MTGNQNETWPELPDGVRPEDFTLVRSDTIERDPVKSAAGKMIGKSLLMVIRQLAAVYAGHPGYCKDWRVDA